MRSFTSENKKTGFSRAEFSAHFPALSMKGLGKGKLFRVERIKISFTDSP